MSNQVQQTQSPPYPEGQTVHVSVEELQKHPRNNDIYVNDDLGDLPDRMERDGFDDDFELIIKPDGTVISGHRRWQAAKEAGIEAIPASVQSFESEAEELGKLLRANDYRDKTAAEIINEGDAWRDYHENDKTLDSVSGKEYDDLAVQEISVGKDTFRKGRKVKEIATGERRVSDHVQQVAKEQWQKMQLAVDDEESQSFNGAYEAVQQAELEAEERRKKEQLELQRAEDFESNDETVETYFADFQVALRDYDKEEIDHIITDPPYGEEALSVWSDLAKHAARVLKDGGFLIAYSGKAHLPRVHDRLGEHLDYHWQAIVRHKGQGAKIFSRNLRTNYKPILIYSNGKPDVQEDFVTDVIDGSGREKDKHEWQQGEAEAAELIERFTETNDVICDPMCGSGTVGVAAQRLQRQCVVIDSDSEAIHTTRRRLLDES